MHYQVQIKNCHFLFAMPQKTLFSSTSMYKFPGVRFLIDIHCDSTRLFSSTRKSRWKIKILEKPFVIQFVLLYIYTISIL